MPRRSTGEPAASWGIGSGAQGQAYRMPMQHPTGVLTYGVVNGHLMQWWENSRRPHFSVVVPGFDSKSFSPPPQQPVETILTPSNYLAAVQDGQDRNVGPLPYLMALAPVKLPHFHAEPQDEREHLHAHLRLGRRAGTGYPSAKRSPPPLTPRWQASQETRPCTDAVLRIRPLGCNTFPQGSRPLDFAIAARFSDSVPSVGDDGTCHFSYKAEYCSGDE